MKANIDGIEVEGTAEEILAFIKEMKVTAAKEPKEYVTYAKQRHKQRRYKRGARGKERKRLIEEAMTESHDTGLSLSAALRKEGIPVCGSTAKKARRVYKKMFGEEYGRTRRGGKAMSQAAAEWVSYRYPSKQPVKSKPFVKLLEDEGTNKILMDVLARIAETCGTMTFAVEGPMFGIESNDEWEKLCLKIISSSSEIAAMLSVPNHFKYDVKTHNIKYG